jgi:hypothetical protein
VFSFSIGLNERSKGNESFLDVLPGARLDKFRQEKLKRFRETLISQLTSPDDHDDSKLEDNRTILTLPWKDYADYPADDSDHQRYLRTLNASIFLRIKSVYERCIHSSPINVWKTSEQIFFHEIVVHLRYYSKLTSHACLGFERFIERNGAFQQWMTLAGTAEHYPFVILGSRASGKTLLCTKLVQYLRNTCGKGSQCVVRYFNLTSRSRHMTELFTSICTQMSCLQSAPALPSEQPNNRSDYYQSVLAAMSKNQKPLILMIDGIEDLSGQNSHSSSMMYYQTLLRLLPPKVRRLLRM